MNINENFKIAFHYHQDGNLQEAERLYREILRVHPDHPFALHLFGVLSCQVGNHDIAIECIRKSISINENNPDAYNHLGTALKAKGLVSGAHKSLLDTMPKIRDYAMHANWTKITEPDVSSVIGFVEQFLLSKFSDG